METMAGWQLSSQSWFAVSFPVLELCHICKASVSCLYAVRVVKQEPALNGNCSLAYYKQVSPPHLTIAFRWQVSRLSAKDTELCWVSEWVSEWHETKERCWCVHKCRAYGGAAPFIQMRPHYGAHGNRTCHRQYHSNNAATVSFLMLLLSERHTGEAWGPADKAMLLWISRITDMAVTLRVWNCQLKQVRKG